MKSLQKGKPARSKSVPAAGLHRKPQETEVPGT